VDLGELEKACQEGEKPRANHVHNLLNDNKEDQASLDKRNEYIDIYLDVRGRYPDFVSGTVAEVKHIRSIKEEAAKLNLAYERQEDWAVRIFRKMVTECLTGVQVCSREREREKKASSLQWGLIDFVFVCVFF